MLTVLLAVSWLPLTAHCQLESISGLNFLRCQSAEESCPTESSHCDRAACCGWESGQCRLPQSQPLPLAEALGKIVPPTLNGFEKRVPVGVTLAIESASSPIPALPWQFSLRAALLPRAPSLPA